MALLINFIGFFAGIGLGLYGLRKLETKIDSQKEHWSEEYIKTPEEVNEEVENGRTETERSDLGTESEGDGRSPTGSTEQGATGEGTGEHSELQEEESSADAGDDERDEPDETSSSGTDDSSVAHSESPEPEPPSWEQESEERKE